MAGEERILVSVRLRPVNAREAERGDGSDWECAGPTTLMFRGNIPERAMFPATYTYGEPTIPPRCLHVLDKVARSNSFLHLRFRQGVPPGVQHPAGVRGRGQAGGPVGAPRHQLYAHTCINCSIVVAATPLP
jgi:hypothetical protein